MNKAKAATVISALVNADFEPSMRIDNLGNYLITVRVVNGIAINTVKTFQDAQAIVGAVKEVEFS